MAAKPFMAVVVALLVCGSLNTLTIKVAYTLTGEGANGDIKQFKKPWFITFLMFVGMCAAICFDKSLWRRRAKGYKQALLDEAPGASVVEPSLNWGKIRLVAIPAAFDILATGLASSGFLFLPASVWQLFRGAEMIFTAIFAVICLRRRLFAFHWLGIFLCSAGIVSVGLASVWGAGVADGGIAGDSGHLVLGMCLCLAAQVVQALQVVAEEWLLKDLDLPGVQIIGFEGIWGVVIFALLVFPVLELVPGPDNGHLEDEIDAAHLVTSTAPLASLICVYLFSCMTFNMAGIMVTDALSAVHRVMIEAFRTCIVWVFGLSVHYFYDPSCQFGEVWTKYSWLEVAGFFVLMLGQTIYGEMLRVPCLKYPAGGPWPTPSDLVTPGTLKHLASPLPRQC